MYVPSLFRTKFPNTTKLSVNHTNINYKCSQYLYKPCSSVKDHDPTLVTRKFTAADPNFEAKVRDSFNRQGLMKSMGAIMTTVKPGFVEIQLPFSDKVKY